MNLSVPQQSFTHKTIWQSSLEQGIMMGIEVSKRKPHSEDIFLLKAHSLFENATAQLHAKDHYTGPLLSLPTFFVCSCTHVPVCVHVEARCQWWVSPSVTLHLMQVKHVSSLTGQQAWNLLSPAPHCFGYIHIWKCPILKRQWESSPYAYISGMLLTEPSHQAYCQLYLEDNHTVPANLLTKGNCKEQNASRIYIFPSEYFLIASCCI